MRLAPPDRFLRAHLCQATHASSITIVSTPIWISETFSIWKWIPIPLTSLACDPLEELGKPEKKDEFSATRHLWFLRHDTPWNATYDKRKPGLFKVEWKADGFVGLKSKTYCCWGTESNKASCKRHYQETEQPSEEVYLNVLQTQRSQSDENRGFPVVANKVLTFAQHRTGFSYFYPKRKVLEDGGSTVPLEI